MDQRRYSKHVEEYPPPKKHVEKERNRDTNKYRGISMGSTVCKLIFAVNYYVIYCFDTESSHYGMGQHLAADQL